ncbi:hypothetical protein [uncultured Rubinisphaera sp.]|uniref:hypothetical protein n=1 Tax=uncultured Rubinisphaera sp. TaxID=1678686 RepID=UPI0030DC5042
MWSFELVLLARSVVQLHHGGLNILDFEFTEIAPVQEVLSQEPVGVGRDVAGWFFPRRLVAVLIVDEGGRLAAGI